LNIEQLYQVYLQNPSVQTDTRKLQAGDLFFALSGPNFNGNQFAKKALEVGASYAIVDENVDANNQRIIVVENVLETLQQLAKYHRQQFNIPVIGITGSNGKTTTKELVNAVLSSYYKTYTTQGNLNNHIGIPLTLLRIKSDAEMAVIEMGANHLKEIAGYCEYVMPTHGIITNCGKAHLEGFGSIEGVRKGKGELFDYLRLNTGTALIYSDYEYLREMSAGIKTFTYGTREAEVTGHALVNEPFLQVAVETNNVETISTNLVGEYNLPNVLCAVAAGICFNVPIQEIKDAIEQYTPDNSRSQMLVRGTNHIILDAYNANPSSMLVAINNLAKMNAGKKVLLLGAMMELGEESLQEHQNIIDIVGKHQWTDVVLVGGDYARLEHSYHFFSSTAEATQWYKQQNFSNTYQLIKGSRSMQMEKILE
jgi:UDP-N-acetylmuramoyl-tripeptide--D-alanyl-D-alanine ligase